MKETIPTLFEWLLVAGGWAGAIIIIKIVYRSMEED